MKPSHTQRHATPASGELRLWLALALACACGAGPVGAATSTVPLSVRSHLLSSSAFLSAAHTTVVSNPASGRVHLFVTNSQARDFRVLIKEGTTYKSDPGAIRSRPDGMEISVPKHVPYIIRSDRTLKAVLGTNRVRLPGAIGLDEAPTNGISVQLVNDWRRFDALSGTYTSIVEICFLAPDSAASRKCLPLTVTLRGSTGVAIPNRAIVLTNVGHASCSETIIECKDRKDNALIAESDIGNVELAIPPFPLDPFLYRILPQPVFWTTFVGSLLGSFVRLTRPGKRKGKSSASRLLVEFMVGLIAAFAAVGFLWAGVGVGNIPVAAVGKLAGVGAVSIIAGLAGRTLLDLIAKQQLPPE